MPAGRMLTGEAAIGGGGRPIVLFARRRRRRRWSLTAAAKPLLKVIRLPLMQCKLTGIRDSPTLCHSSSACPVNLRCISTGAHADPHHGVVLSSVDGPERAPAVGVVPRGHAGPVRPVRPVRPVPPRRPPRRRDHRCSLGRAHRAARLPTWSCVGQLPAALCSRRIRPPSRWSR